MRKLVTEIEEDGEETPVCTIASGYGGMALLHELAIGLRVMTTSGSSERIDQFYSEYL